MNIHEYQAKELLRAAVPRCRTAMLCWTRIMRAKRSRMLGGPSGS